MADLDPTFLSATGNRARGLGGLRQGRELQFVGIGETRLLTADGTQSGALFDAEVAILDDAVFQNPGLKPAGLEIDIRRIHHGTGQSAQEAIQIVFDETGLRQETVAGNGNRVIHKQRWLKIR